MRLLELLMALQWSMFIMYLPALLIVCYSWGVCACVVAVAPMARCFAWLV